MVFRVRDGNENHSRQLAASLTLISDSRTLDLTLEIARKIVFKGILDALSSDLATNPLGNCPK